MEWHVSLNLPNKAQNDVGLTSMNYLNNFQMSMLLFFLVHTNEIC